MTTEQDRLNSILNLIDNTPDIFEGLNPKHREKFMEWLPDNLHILVAFGRYALELKNSNNRPYYSAYAIRERLRWDSMISENGTDYKLSNNVTPYISRLIMKMDRRLAGMFKTHDKKPPDFRALIQNQIDFKI